jgi:hypothetical protein
MTPPALAASPLYRAYERTPLAVSISYVVMRIFATNGPPQRSKAEIEGGDRR